MLIPASSPLPRLDSAVGFTILTYNVLIPNSNDGYAAFGLKPATRRSRQASLLLTRAFA